MHTLHVCMYAYYDIIDHHKILFLSVKILFDVVFVLCTR